MMKCVGYAETVNPGPWLKNFQRFQKEREGEGSTKQGKIQIRTIFLANEVILGKKVGLFQS